MTRIDRLKSLDRRKAAYENRLVQIMQEWIATWNTMTPEERRAYRASESKPHG